MSRGWCRVVSRQLLDDILEEMAVTYADTPKEQWEGEMPAVIAVSIQTARNILNNIYKELENKEVPMPKEEYLEWAHAKEANKGKR